METDNGKIVRAYKSTCKRHGTLNLFAALEVATGEVIFGTHPEGLHDRLLADGWEMADDPDQMLSYRHTTDGTLMRDSHPKNFIETPNGLLVPIDVIFVP